MASWTKNNQWGWVAGGVAFGAGLGFAVGRVLSGRRPYDSSVSKVWSEEKSYAHPEGTPEGFTMRGTCSKDNKNGVTVFMEKWKAGSEEPIHSHPQDDMTIVVDGKMSIQFFKKTTGGELVPDGQRIYLNKGDVGYISANRIHDAKYIEDCNLVYVHSKEFGFKEEKAEI